MRSSSWIAGLCLLVSPVAGLNAAAVDARQLLQEMNQAIGALDQFVIHGESYVDAGLPRGQIIEQTSEVTVKMKRPSALSITNLHAEGSKELHMVDGVLTVNTQPENYYAQTEVPDQVELAVEFAMENLDIDAPLLDLLTSDPAQMFSSDAESIEYLGQSRMRGSLHHQIAIRGPDIDLQIWIAAEGPALPRKISMSSRWEFGNPRFVGFMRWDLDPEIPDDSLEFRPTPDAVRIEFVQQLEEDSSNE